METFKVRPDSLSYKWTNSLSTRWADEYDRPKDYCAYWRHVLLWSPLMFAILVLLFAFIGSIIIGAIMNPGDAAGIIGLVVILGGIIYGVVWFLENYGNRFVVPVIEFIWKWSGLHFLIVTVLGTAFVWFFTKIGDWLTAYFVWRDERKPKKEPKPKAKPVERDPTWWENLKSFFYTRYKSWKENYCPMLEYVE